MIFYSFVFVRARATSEVAFRVYFFHVHPVPVAVAMARRCCWATLLSKWSQKKKHNPWWV